MSLGGFLLFAILSIFDRLGIHLGSAGALVIGLGISLAASLVIMPIAIPKLIGAGIVGQDRHKPGRPDVAEMGGIGVFLAFNAGAFFVLVAADFAQPEELLIIASLVVGAGACITGILDDMIELQQKFKAFIPFAFAIPFALYADDWLVEFPGIGGVDLGLAYPFLLVPVAIMSASQAFNMLEGFNGLGASLGLVIAAALSIIIMDSGRLAGLSLLFPLMGALAGFLWFNFYPAKVFPGDTMTLTVGALLASAALLSKIEFWAGLLFLPHILEFVIKGANGFPTRGWGGDLVDGKLFCPPKRPVGLAQWFLKVFGGLSEANLVLAISGAIGLYSAVVVAFAILF